MGSEGFRSCKSNARCPDSLPATRPQLIVITEGLSSKNLTDSEASHRAISAECSSGTDPNATTLRWGCGIGAPGAAYR